MSENPIASSSRRRILRALGRSSTINIRALFNLRSPSLKIGAIESKLQIRGLKLLGLNFDSNSSVDDLRLDKFGYCLFQPYSYATRGKGSLPTKRVNTIGVIVPVVEDKGFAISLKMLGENNFSKLCSKISSWRQKCTIMYNSKL